MLLTLYGLGVLVALWRTDDRWPARVIVSLCWPLGPIAFIIVVTGLTLVAVGLWPFITLPILAALALLVRWLA